MKKCNMSVHLGGAQPQLLTSSRVNVRLYAFPSTSFTKSSTIPPPVESVVKSSPLTPTSLARAMLPLPCLALPLFCLAMHRPCLPAIRRPVLRRAERLALLGCSLQQDRNDSCAAWEAEQTKAFPAAEEAGDSGACPPKRNQNPAVSHARPHYASIVAAKGGVRQYAPRKDRMAAQMQQQIGVRSISNCICISSSSAEMKGHRPRAIVLSCQWVGGWVDGWMGGWVQLVGGWYIIYLDLDSMQITE